jgi:hypothetical protein
MPPSLALLTGCSLALLPLFGCGDPVMPRVPVEHVVAASGGGQPGHTLDTLPEHLVVRVVDDGGRPVAGRPVTWSFTSDGAQVIPVTPVTDVTGTARAVAILGFEPGTQRFTAHVTGFDEGADFVFEAASRPGFKAVSLMRAGIARHMCALDADRRAWCWGPNESGQLGSGDLVPGTAPRRVTADLQFVRLWGLWAGTCGLTTAAELWCWGTGYGNGVDLFLGAGTDENLRPVRVAPALRLLDFDVDVLIACGVTLEHAAYCWGSGVLGDGTPRRHARELVRVAGAMQWLEISLEDSRVCAVDITHAVHCWGSDPMMGTASVPALIPTAVQGLPPLTGITSGWGIGTAAQCGLSATGGGMMICWGTWNGEITAQRLGDTPVREARIEVQTGMALATDGRLWIWGEPPEGYDGGISAVPVPLEPAGPWLDFTSTSEEGAFAISARDSVVYRWTGFPGFGPPTGLLPSPVPAGAGSP